MNASSAQLEVKTRPKWSVMIPTYNPDAGYLRKTIESILAQDPGPGKMQIVVVDDASPKGETQAIIDSIAPGRVTCHVQKQNRGLAGNWNHCVEIAEGEWIHLLHQDDVIYPGFYSQFEKLIDTVPGIDAAFCRHQFIDGDGKVISTTDAERETAGVLENFVDRIFVTQIIQCPSIVVAKKTYERVGLFRTDLPYALDWDMWKRIAANGVFAYLPDVLAAYRVHEDSETARLRTLDYCFRDTMKSVKIASQYLPAEKRRGIGKRARNWAVDFETGCIWRLLHIGEQAAARRAALQLLIKGYISRSTLRVFACTFRSR